MDPQKTPVNVNDRVLITILRGCREAFGSLWRRGLTVHREKSCIQRRGGHLLKATAYRMRQQRVQRLELVALSPVVITFLSKPQWRHKVLEHGMAFRHLKLPVLNQVLVVKTLHAPLQTYGELNKNGTSYMRRESRKTSKANHRRYTTTQRA